MESKYSTKILNEVPMEVYRSMSHELHRLQINSHQDQIKTLKPYFLQHSVQENLGQGSPADVREAKPDTVSKQTRYIRIYV
ncbi:hypothetical protein MKW94_005875 [Papaver nudicaule]|uniref:Uncharacterized protein n=1 Tax=Papaver nudicaule TaxID=74823 RepID=A0AA41W127_PAPNU|nr:hypothetical protein [Papaver nudicaule]